ncbi:MAG: restriction endonuclease subunit S [Mycoplasmataceae bacterium]|nr:restriction endonuclease subunit S [Mycoplasmataceae bacterium]
MEIVKLGDICNISTGNKNKDDECFNRENYYPFYTRSTKILKSNDYSFDGECIIVPGEGIFTPMWNDGKCAIHQRVYKIITKDSFKLKNKYLFFWWTKNQNILYKEATGSTVKSLRKNNFETPLIALPNIEQQQVIIDIIEPFEKEKYIRENMNRTLLELIKNHNANNVLDEKVTLNDLVLRTKKKNPENYQNVIDLSSINNDSLTFFSFKKTSDFNSNIFETKEGDLFLSSIRPSLKKYGISPFNMNILGTLFNFRPLIYENRGLILSCISSNNFQNFLIQSSEGTKMPIVKWDKFKDFKLRKINNNESLLFNNIFDFIKLNNQILNVLEKILNNLIELHIK